MNSHRAISGFGDRAQANSNTSCSLCRAMFEPRGCAAGGSSERNTAAASASPAARSSNASSGLRLGDSDLRLLSGRLWPAQPGSAQLDRIWAARTRRARHAGTPRHRLPRRRDTSHGQGSIGHERQTRVAPSQLLQARRHLGRHRKIGLREVDIHEQREERTGYQGRDRHRRGHGPRRRLTQERPTCPLEEIRAGEAPLGQPEGRPTSVSAASGLIHPSETLRPPRAGLVGPRGRRAARTRSRAPPA